VWVSESATEALPNCQSNRKVPDNCFVVEIFWLIHFVMVSESTTKLDCSSKSVP
jgi:hypothetical protein